MSKSVTPSGYLHHWSSRKQVHPRGGAFNPEEDTELTVHIDKRDPDRLQFRFVPVDGAGHFGYIEHVTSQKVVHPADSSLTPGDDTYLVLRTVRNACALFTFDEENRVIMHKSGKVWHPKRQNPNPGNTTSLMLHSDQNDAGKFYFGDLDGKAMSPYAEPELSGEWKLLQAFVSPKTDHTYTLKYKLGKSKTDSRKTRHAWGAGISGKVAKNIFKAKLQLEYSGFTEGASSETWSEEKTQEHTLHVKEGQSVWVWQYVFGMSQYGDQILFQSNIIGDSDRRDEKPKIRK